MDWIFQANPKRYDLPAAIASGKDRNWAMNQGHHLVSPGDRVFFWVSGADARLVAVGHVISPVYDRGESEFGTRAVDVSYDDIVEPPLTRQEIGASWIGSLAFNPFARFMGTNFRIGDGAISATLDELLKGRLRAASGEPPPPVIDIQRGLDSAIKGAQREVGRELSSHIASMDPTTFEWLIRALLMELGYSDIIVTKASNDGGIDLRAKLIAGGIANIKTAVQVKRTKSVGRPVVQNLRGSLSAHETGLLVTSGSFTEGAEAESQDLTKAAIALMNGSRLVELLLEHQIGVRQKIFKVYSLDPASLDIDALQARSEVTS